MEVPLDQFILEDNLSPDEMALVEWILNDCARNRITIIEGRRASFGIVPTRNGSAEQGYLYCRESGGPRFFPADLSPVLRHLNLIQPAPGRGSPDWPSSWFTFTEAAYAWRRKYGGLTIDGIREVIGRIVLAQQKQEWPDDFDDEAIARGYDLELWRVRDQVVALMTANLLESWFQGQTRFGKMQLTRPVGTRWAASGFAPLGDLVGQSVSAADDSLAEVRAIIRQIRTMTAEPIVLVQFESCLHRVAEEMEKPGSEGRYQHVKELVETANSSRELLGVVLPFLTKHWHQIQRLADSES